MIRSATEFQNLMEQDDEQSRLRLCSETASESVWEEIIAKFPELKRAVTLNKTLPEGILRLLAKDLDPLVRADIAMKRALPADIFSFLANDSDELVRARIAWNEKTPADLLRKLAADVSHIVAEPAQKCITQK